MCKKELDYLNQRLGGNPYYGAECMVGNAPQVGDRPIQSPRVVEAKQRTIYYINKDNKHICTPIYPISGIEDNQPKTCDIYNV